MGAFTSAQTGNWGDIATWTDGSAVPGDGDTVTIAVGHTVTVEADATVGAGGTPGTVEIDITGGLVIGAGVTLTIKGDVKLNNGSSVVLSAGARWVTATDNYTIKYSGVSTFTINGSSGSRCYLGANAELYTRFLRFSATSDTLNCDWNYCDFVRLGSGSLAGFQCGGHNKTIEFIIDNCYFDYFGQIEYSFAGPSPNVDSKIQITNTDFRHPLATFIIVATPRAGLTTDRFIKNCTFIGRSSSSPGQLYLRSPGFLVENVVTMNVKWDIESLEVSKCTLYQDYAHNTIYNVAGGASVKIHDCAVISNANNCHPFTFPAAFSGTVDFERNFFDSPLAIGDTTNCIMAQGVASSNINIKNNIFIGHNPLLPSSAGAGNVLFEQNTDFNGNNADYMVLFETAIPSGLTTVRSNIRYEDGDSAHSYRPGGGLILSIIGTDQAHNVWTDNNCVWDSPLDASRYENFIITGKALGDAGFGGSDIRVNPNFKNKGRNFLSWVGASTYADGIEELMCINGRDSSGATKTHDASKTIDALLEYIRDAYTPTNMTLLTAGYDGGYIGALEPQSADDTAPNLTSATATATGPTTATASVTTDDGNGTLYFLASENTTESAATVKAALSQSVTTAGEQSISLSALNPGTTYYVHFVQINGAGLESDVVSTSAITTQAIVYPVISAITAASSTSAVSATVTTDTAGGTIYGVLSNSATEMDAADIKSGTDDSAEVTDAGDYTLNETGLETWTQYYWHIVHEDTDGLMSNVLTIPVRTLDIAIPLAFQDTAPATLLTVQVWSRLPKKAEVEGLY